MADEPHWLPFVPEQLSGTSAVHPGTGHNVNIIWVRSRNCGCLVTWFCYQLIAKPGNKTAAVPWPDPYSKWHYLWLILLTHWMLACWIGLGNKSIYLHFISFVDTRPQNFAFYPSALRAGGVLSSRFGRAGSCQTCGTHISITAWRMFSIRSSVELSTPVVVHCHGHLPICPIWACPWAKNLSNLSQIGSRLCGTHISETAAWIYPI